MGRHKKPAHNRKRGVPRLPNGQLARTTEADKLRKALDKTSYDQAQRETMLPALETRIRKYGIPPEVALDQYAGSAMGRMALAGTISAQQMAAGVMWLEERANYAAAIGGPSPDRAADLCRTPGITHADNPERDREIITCHRAARDAVHSAQTVLGMKSNLWAAINLIIERDQDLPHLAGDLREALNALAAHYRLIPNGQRRAA